MDLDGPPKAVMYISGYKVGGGVQLNEAAVGRECTDCIKAPVDGCCAGVSDNPIAYNDSMQVKIRPGMPIYECNSLCQCGIDCKNGVVQRGIQYDLCIFKTANGRGWGVRAHEKIPKNSFVIEYLGDVSALSFTCSLGRHFCQKKKKLRGEAEYNARYKFPSAWQKQVKVVGIT